jgi:hypothetical protein
MPSNRHPAIIRAVNRERREVRVEIPPFTDGAAEWPIAEIEYPIGDDSRNTEIRLVVDLEVWVAFIAGDPRRPIITGFRNPNAGNEVAWRRWNHDNIEHNADDVANINAKTINLTAGSQINLTVGGSTVVITAGAVTIKSGTINLN